MCGYGPPPTAKLHEQSDSVLRKRMPALAESKERKQTRGLSRQEGTGGAVRIWNVQRESVIWNVQRASDLEGILGMQNTLMPVSLMPDTPIMFYCVFMLGILFFTHYFVFFVVVVMVESIFV